MFRMFFFPDSVVRRLIILCFVIGVSVFCACRVPSNVLLLANSRIMTNGIFFEWTHRLKW